MMIKLTAILIFLGFAAYDILACICDDDDLPAETWDTPINIDPEPGPIQGDMSYDLPNIDSDPVEFDSDAGYNDDY